MIEKILMRASDRAWSGPACTVEDKPNDFDCAYVVMNAQYSGQSMEQLRTVPIIQDIMCFFGLDLFEIRCTRSHRVHNDYKDIESRGPTELDIIFKCKF